MRGWTLLEFMIVLAISAIFLTSVVPAYRTVIQNNKIVSATNKLSASLQLARMEAIKRGTQAAICPANTAYTACGTSWAQGFVVFQDKNKNLTVDSSQDLIKVTQGFGEKVKITTASNAVTFDGNGFTTSGATSFNISVSGCTGNNARTLNLSANGRVSIVPAACN